MKRILIVGRSISGLTVGGMESITKVFIESLPKDLYEISLLGPNLEKSSSLLPHSKIFTFNSREDRYTIKYWFQLFKKRKIIGQQDIIYSAGNGGILFAFLPSQRRKLIIHTHQTEMNNLRDAILNMQLAKLPIIALRTIREVLGLHLVHGVIAVSETVSQDLAKFPYCLTSTTVINPVESESFRFDPTRRSQLRKELGIDENMPLAIFAGRLVRSKKVHKLIDLWIQKGFSYTLLIVGKGPEGENLKKLSKSHSNIKFIGWIDHSELPNYFSAADIFVSFSNNESFYLTAVEAYFSGLQMFTTPKTKNLLGSIGIPEMEVKLINNLSESIDVSRNFNYNPKLAHELSVSKFREGILIYLDSIN